MEKKYDFAFSVFGNNGDLMKEGEVECTLVEFCEFILNMSENFGYSVEFEKYPCIEEVIASFN